MTALAMHNKGGVPCPPSRRKVSMHGKCEARSERSWAIAPKTTVCARRSIILVEPQLGENIGQAARAMANFGLERAAAGRASRRLAE